MGDIRRKSTIINVWLLHAVDPSGGNLLILGSVRKSRDPDLYQ